MALNSAGLFVFRYGVCALCDGKLFIGLIWLFSNDLLDTIICICIRFFFWRFRAIKAAQIWRLPTNLPITFSRGKLNRRETPQKQFVFSYLVPIAYAVMHRLGHLFILFFWIFIDSKVLYLWICKRHNCKRQNDICIFMPHKQ